MDKLIYKSFTWPQNPDHCKHTYVREPVYTKNEANETVFSGMGPKKLTITGSGAFFGATAYDDFRELALLFNETTLGGLVHPVLGTLRCFFTKLEMTQEPRSDYVAYEFEFREADSEGELPQ